MGRPLTLISCVVALAAGVGAALAAAAPARHDSRMIPCPLEPNDTITTPCCGPPIVTAAASPAFVCCGTPLPINCPTGLTLSSSADPSVAGQKITLSGRWPGNTAGQTVDLFQELPGAKMFSKVAQTKTGSLGDFQFVRKAVQTNRKWYVAVGSEHSLTISQRVKAVVTVTAGLHDLRGHVFPSHPRERVWVQEKASSGWTSVARPRLDRKSNYRVRGSLCKMTGGDGRVVFPGDRLNARSASRELVAICGGY